MCNIHLFSDNAYSLAALEHLLEKVTSSGIEEELTVFLFEKKWLSEDDMSALQACRTGRAFIFAQPELHEFITSFIKNYSLSCFDYGMSLDDIQLSFSTLKKNRRSVKFRNNTPYKRSFMLTNIEQTVIELFLSGRTIVEISDALGKKDKAVYQYKSIAMKKIGVATTAGLVNLGKYYIPHKTSEIRT